MTDQDLDQRLARTLADHRHATEARRAANLVAAPPAPPAAGSSLRRPAGRRLWLRPGDRPWLTVALATAVVAGLLGGIAALERGGRLDEQRIDAADTTLPSAIPPESTTSTSDPGGSSTTSAVSPGPDRSRALWFRNHFDGLADDQGTIYRQRNGVDYIGPMVRTADGTIYLVQDQQLFLLRADQVEPEPVPAAGPVGGLVELDRDGEVVWLDGQNTFRRLDGTEAPGDPAWTAPAAGGPGGERTATNGWTARLRLAEVVRDPSTGMVDDIAAPAELEIVDPAGTVARTFLVGGSSATGVALEDFDGRRVIVSRAPEEPAGSPSQMLLIDLACDPVCVRTSIGLGDTVLNGADVTGDPPLAPLPGGSTPSAASPLGLCATEGSAIPDPPVQLSSPARQAYRGLALALATCDPFTFRGATADAVIPWSLLAAALSSPPIETSTDGQPAQMAWTFTDPASERWVSIDASGLWTVDEPTGGN